MEPSGTERNRAEPSGTEGSHRIERNRAEPSGTEWNQQVVFAESWWQSPNYTKASMESGKRGEKRTRDEEEQEKEDLGFPTKAYKKKCVNLADPNPNTAIIGHSLGNRLSGILSGILQQLQSQKPVIDSVFAQYNTLLAAQAARMKEMHGTLVFLSKKVKQQEDTAAWMKQLDERMKQIEAAVNMIVLSHVLTARSSGAPVAPAFNPASSTSQSLSSLIHAIEKKGG